MTAGDRSLPGAWMARARDDIALAEAALERGITWGAVYHAQQAAEKSLKGRLAGAGLPPVPTHDLLLLSHAAAARGVGVPAIETELELLQPYGIEPRYPEVSTEYSVEDAERAIEAARRVVAAVEEVTGAG